MQFGINVLLLAALAQSWNIIGGFTGYPRSATRCSSGSALRRAITMVQWHLPFALALPIGGGAWPGLRAARRDAHPEPAAATISPSRRSALAATMGAIVANLQITGGEYRPHPAADSLRAARSSTSCWTSRAGDPRRRGVIAAHRFGFGLIAIREDEDARHGDGNQHRPVQGVALVLAGLFTALVGGISPIGSPSSIPSSAFGPSLTVQMVIMAVFGGLAR